MSETGREFAGDAVLEIEKGRERARIYRFGGVAFDVKVNHVGWVATQSPTRSFADYAKTCAARFIADFSC